MENIYNLKNLFRNRYKITCSKLFPKPLKRLGILKTKDQVILEPILSTESGAQNGMA